MYHQILASPQKRTLSHKDSAFLSVLFLYFVTLHADLLNIRLYLFSFRFNNVIAAIMFVWFILKFRVFLLNTRTIYPLLGLLILQCINIPSSVHPVRCIGFLFQMIFVFTCYFFLPYLILQKQNTQTFLKCYYLSFVFVGFYALFQLFAPFLGFKAWFSMQSFYGTFYRPNALSYEPSYYALYMTPFVVIVNTSALLKVKSEYLPSLKKSFVLLVNFMFLGSTSTSAFFAYMIWILVLLLFSTFKMIKKIFPKILLKTVHLIMLLSGTFTVLAILLYDIFSAFYLKFFIYGVAHYSFEARWKGIENGFQLFLQSPVFGVGIGGIGPYITNAINKGSNLFRGQGGDYLSYVTLNDPSNVFTEILAGTGLVGMLLCFIFGRTIYKQYKKLMLSLHASDTTKQVATIMIMSVVAMLVAWQFNQSLLRPYTWTHIAIVASFITKNESSEKTQC